MFGNNKLKVKEGIEETREKNLRAEGLVPPDKPKVLSSTRFEIRRYATAYEERVLDTETGEEMTISDFIVALANEVNK